MNLLNLFDMNNYNSISDTHAISCSEGTFDGWECETLVDADGFTCTRDNFCVRGTFTVDDDIVLRTDSITNTSEKPLKLYDYKMRFCFPGEEYEIFTLFNSWQNESRGQWQTLTTTVEAGASGARTSDCNVPMLAVYSKQTHRGVVFHVIPTAAWSIKASKRRSDSRRLHTVIELSLAEDIWDFTLNQGETFTMPQVLYYEFTDKLSLDAPKLHRYLAKHYPRKSMPVIYNTWLAFFDRIDLRNVYAQIDRAAKLGCDYFTLDAGWFGNGDNWDKCIGEWYENTDSAYEGQMNIVSERVHAKGMKFGLWLEGERALPDTKMVKAHPEYFFFNGSSYILNYGYAPAREYITKLTIDLAKQYHISFFKFDFNANMHHDPSHKAFASYLAGYKQYIKDIRTALPDVYLECCAAGGYRTNLETLKLFDSYWFTDNQSVYESMRIYKDSLCHMLPCAIEKWAALIVRDEFLGEYDVPENTTRLLSTDSATWSRVISTTPSYLEGFFAGGCVGITSDLIKLDEKTFAALKETIANYKAEAPFWMNASCRLLIDTERILALQYENGSTVKIVIYTNIVTQDDLEIHPVLDGKYTYKGKTADWSKEGIRINDIAENTSYILTLTKA